MKSIRIALLCVLAWILVFVLAACGGLEPVTMDNIPVFAGAQLTTNADYMTLSDAMMTALKDSGQLKSENLETRIYTAGKSTAWESVQQYYDTELAKANWMTNAKLAYNSPTVHGKGWIRG